MSAKAQTPETHEAKWARILREAKKKAQASYDDTLEEVQKAIMEANPKVTKEEIRKEAEEVFKKLMGNSVLKPVVVEEHAQFPLLGRVIFLVGTSLVPWSIRSTL